MSCTFGGGGRGGGGGGRGWGVGGWVNPRRACGAPPRCSSVQTGGRMAGSTPGASRCGATGASRLGSGCPPAGSRSLARLARGLCASAWAARGRARSPPGRVPSHSHAPWTTEHAAGPWQAPRTRSQTRWETLQRPTGRQQRGEPPEPPEGRTMKLVRCVVARHAIRARRPARPPKRPTAALAETGRPEAAALPSAAVLPVLPDAPAAAARLAVQRTATPVAALQAAPPVGPPPPVLDHASLAARERWASPAASSPTRPPWTARCTLDCTACCAPELRRGSGCPTA